MLYIDLPTRAEIAKLIGFRGNPAVTLYLRTTPVTQDAQGDRIELRNLLKAAVAQVEAAGVAKRDVEGIRDRVEDLIGDDEFWAKQAHSLAVFAAPGFLRAFRLANRLSNAVEVSDRFLLAQLIRAVTFSHHAFLLPISIGSARLVEVLPDGPVDEVSVPGLPKGAADAAGRRSHALSQAEHQDGARSDQTVLYTRYARAVDAALRPTLAGQERPLIVVASEPMASIFRSVCSYPHLVAETISLSADETPNHELAAAARPLLDRLYAAEVASLRDLYETRKGQGRTTADIAQAARAATFGAIDTLLIDMDEDVPGFVDEETGAVTFDDKADAVNHDVTDEIARRAWATGARVVAARRADIPDGAALAAILRYAF
ncbi:hypothetical protein DFR50_12521 [Roseiarcus fermentans]|uniref:Uncharacterized protein n=1 Tax=Roseiarcus fermentans TaxID=1473586 RepID=A0A366F442_9HYPH|nr:hypothetical protein [Roseiarcus fermentans]RBP08539.1 hypothetical protein DFR50_12521 [Roseiarcus fermentans]